MKQVFRKTEKTEHERIWIIKQSTNLSVTVKDKPPPEEMEIQNNAELSAHMK